MTTVENVEEVEMAENLKLHNPDVVPLLFHEVKSQIINYLIEQKATLRQIAKDLNINPGTVKRHLVDLENFGLIRVVSEEINEYGINQIYYRSIAKNFTIVLDYQKQIDTYLSRLKANQDRVNLSNKDEDTEEDKKAKKRGKK